MKRILGIILSITALLCTVGCKNVNDVENVAKRGITISAIRVVPSDATSANEIFETTAEKFIAGGLGLNNWGAWDAENAFVGINIDNEIRLFPGAKIEESNYANYYGNIEFCGTTADGSWAKRLVPDGKNAKLDNPRDGKTYYVNLVVNQDGTTKEATLVEGTLPKSVMKITLTDIPETAPASLKINSNISWGGVKKGLWSADGESFGNAEITIAVENQTAVFYVTGNYDITEAWTDEQKKEGTNFKMELTGDSNTAKWFYLSTDEKQTLSWKAGKE